MAFGENKNGDFIHSHIENSFDSNKTGGPHFGGNDFWNILKRILLFVPKVLWTVLKGIGYVIAYICKSKLGRILIIVLVLIFGFKGYIAFSRIYGSIDNARKLNAYMKSEYGDIEAAEPLLDDAMSDEAILETLDVPSDITGMTKADKVKKGMKAEDGSDTDGDGLTDKEEIEVYGTDPLKMSTAGDLMTDGEKVKAGLDPKEKSETVPDKEYINKDASGIVFNATRAEDYYAYAASQDGIRTLENKEVYKTYIISGYSGNLTMSVKKITNDNNIRPEDLMVYVAGHGKSKAKSYKFTTEDKKITLTKKFDGNKIYDVYIAKKKGIFNSTATAYMPAARAAAEANGAEIYEKAGIDDANNVSPLNALAGYATEDKAYEPDGIVYGFPLAVMVGSPLTVLYKELPSKDATVAERDNLVMAANQFQQTVNRHTILLGDNKLKVKSASAEEIRAVRDGMRKFYPNGEWTGNNFHDQDLPAFLPKVGYIYFTYETISNMTTLTDMMKDITKQSTANMAITTGAEVWAPKFGYDDILPFANIATGTNGHGNCMGMALTIASVYNNDGLPKDTMVDSYTPQYFNNSPENSEYQGMKLSWDLSGKKNATLFDKKLDDAIKLPYDCREGLKGEKAELANYITAMWAKGNDLCTKAVRNSEMPVYSKNNKPNMSVLYDTLEQLGEGKLVTLVLPIKLTDGTVGGHVINISRAVTLKPDSVWILYGYDNNYPYKEAVGTMALVCTKIKGVDQDHFTFEYTMIGMDDAEKAAYKKAAGFEYPDFTLDDLPDSYVYKMTTMNDDGTVLNHAVKEAN